MDSFPYPPLLVVLFVALLVLCFVIVGYVLWLDYMAHHVPAPSVRDQVLADDMVDDTDATLVDTLAVDATAEIFVPIVEPPAAAMPAAITPPVTPVVPAAAPMPRPPLPTRAPAARSRAFDPASHEQALNEALFVAAQADCVPGVTRLVPVGSVSAESAYDPDVEVHVQQAVATGHSYRDTQQGYAARHRASMA